MTIYDVSKLAGVSIATVSRVLNGSELVSERTRKRVLDVITDSGYTPNVFARGLGLNTMNTIGLLCADISDTHIAQAVFYLQRRLRLSGYDSMICCTEDDAATRRKNVSLLLSKRVDGMIFVGSYFVMPEDEQNRYIREAASRLPVMILIGAMDGDNIYSVYSDDRAATREATQRLIEAGRRDILYLYHAHSYTGRKKMQGYMDALEGAGIPVREELMLYCDDYKDVLKTRDLIDDAARGGAEFDAVMTSADMLGMAAIKYANMRGLRIPEDLQIVGYDNSPMSLCCEPELTTVDTNLEVMCQACVSTLMGALSGQSMPKRSVFSGTLIARRTTSFKP